MSSNAPTLCLNMIVKNESKIIHRMLESVVPILHSYCICDTGSTDDTPNVIRKFFDSRNIPGEIVFEPFRDFGYNRAFALKAANERSTADYILLMDADMILVQGTTPDQIRAKITSDVCHIFQGSNKFFYKNVRLVRNKPGYSYWGVTHEYVVTPPGATFQILDKDIVFISDIGDGGSKSDKQTRDIRLLEQGLVDIPNNDRYTFYLANSYRDNGQHEKAIEFYRKRIALGGWAEECWHSYYSIGKCYQNMGNMESAVYSWMEAYNHTPGRLEALYEIITHFRIIGKQLIAYQFFMIADAERKKGPKWDCLFLQKDKYEFRLDYELSILGYYYNIDNHDLARVSMKVISHPDVEDGIIKNVLSNYKFYSVTLKSLAISDSTANMQILSSIGNSLITSSDFVGSTPTISSLDPNTLVIVRRFVNYSINDKGEYINRDKIETKNVLAIINISAPDWKVVSEREVIHDASLDNRYVGLEDMRLSSVNIDDKIMYTANRGMKEGSMQVEFGKLNICNAICDESVRLTYKKQTRCEKNWVLFPSGENNTKCIYSWSPLLIGDIIDGDKFTETHSIQTPPFFKYLRGSSNGIVIDDEIWFIAHSVSYEDRRYYYHLMVVLDNVTFEVKRYSPLFTFCKERVEYSLGMTYFAGSDHILIGYSIMDRETHFITVSKSAFMQHGALA